MSAPAEIVITRPGEMSEWSDQAVFVLSLLFVALLLLTDTAPWIVFALYVPTALIARRFNHPRVVLSRERVQVTTLLRVYECAIADVREIAIGTASRVTVVARDGSARSLSLSERTTGRRYLPGKVNPQMAVMRKRAAEMYAGTRVRVMEHSQLMGVERALASECFTANTRNIGGMDAAIALIAWSL